MNTNASGRANLRTSLSMLPVQMVMLETLIELCVLVLTFLYNLLPLNLGWPYGLLSPVEYTRSGHWEMPYTIPEITVLGVSSGSCHTRGSMCPQRRDVPFSKERSSESCQLMLLLAPSQFSGWGHVLLSQPPGLQWAGLGTPWSGLPNMTVCAMEPCNGLTETLSPALKFRIVQFSFLPPSILQVPNLHHGVKVFPLF